MSICLNYKEVIPTANGALVISVVSVLGAGSVLLLVVN